MPIGFLGVLTLQYIKVCTTCVCYIVFSDMSLILPTPSLKSYEKIQQISTGIIININNYVPDNYASFMVAILHLSSHRILNVFKALTIC